MDYEEMCNVTIDASMSENDIIHFMRQYKAAKLRPAFVNFSGWDNDPRDLWEIPEATALAKRAMSVGFLSILRRNLPSDIDYVDVLFGQYQVWAWNVGIINNEGRSDITMEDFHKDMVKQKELFDKNTTLHDGQNILNN